MFTSKGLFVALDLCCTYSETSASFTRDRDLFSLEEVWQQNQVFTFLKNSSFTTLDRQCDSEDSYLFIQLQDEKKI